MAKKKAKGKGKRTASRTSAAKKVKDLHPAEVRKEVSAMIETEATEMAQAVIDRGKMGELATVKYLFEMSGVFPASKDSEEGSPREDSLAETLLHRLNIPLDPVNLDSDDEPVGLGSPVVVEEDAPASDASTKSEPGEVDAAVGTCEEEQS